MSGVLFCNCNDIVPLGQIRLVEPEEFPDPSLDSISLNCVTCLLADSNPQSCNAYPVLLENKYKMSRMTSSARPTKIDEILMVE